MPLEAWLHTAPLRGDILLSPIMYSRANDKFYGQWLVLNVPFKHLEELWLDRAALVPAAYKYLTLCVLHRSLDLMNHTLFLGVF